MLADALAEYLTEHPGASVYIRYEDDFFTGLQLDQFSVDEDGDVILDVRR